MRLLVHEVAHTQQQQPPAATGEFDGDREAGSELASSAAQIRRSPPTRTSVLDVDRVDEFASKSDADADYLPPERGFELDWIMERNYTDRQGALQTSLEIYFDRLFSEWSSQGFFDPKNHPTLIEEHKKLQCRGQDQRRSPRHHLQNVRPDQDSGRQRGEQETPQGASGVHRHAHQEKYHEKLSSDYLTTKHRLETKWYDAMEKAAPEKSETYQQLEKRAEEGIEFAEPKIREQNLLVQSLKGELWGPLPTFLAIINSRYEDALLKYEATRQQARDRGFQFVNKLNKSKSWTKSSVVNDEIKAVGVTMSSPKPNDTTKDPKVDTQVRVKPLLAKMSVPDLVALLEKVAIADPNLMQPFVTQAILEFAGTPWKTVHSDWLDPRILIAGLAEYMIEPNRAKKATTSLNAEEKRLWKIYAPLEEKIKKAHPSQAIAYLVELRRTGGKDVYPDFAWANTILNTQLYLEKEFYDELQALDKNKEKGAKYIKADSFGRMIEYNTDADKEMADPISEQWKSALRYWRRKASAAWRPLALGKVPQKRSARPRRGSHRPIELHVQGSRLQRDRRAHAEGLRAQAHGRTRTKRITRPGRATRAIPAHARRRPVRVPRPDAPRARAAATSWAA